MHAIKTPFIEPKHHLIISSKHKRRARRRLMTLKPHRPLWDVFPHGSFFNACMSTLDSDNKLISSSWLVALDSSFNPELDICKLVALLADSAILKLMRASSPHAR
jgi:hypothetical protein